jgi:hypothetical protein
MESAEGGGFGLEEIAFWIDVSAERAPLAIPPLSRLLLLLDDGVAGDGDGLRALLLPATLLAGLAGGTDLIGVCNSAGFAFPPPDAIGITIFEVVAFDFCDLS